MTLPSVTGKSTWSSLIDILTKSKIVGLVLPSSKPGSSLDTHVDDTDTSDSEDCDHPLHRISQVQRFQC